MRHSRPLFLYFRLFNTVDSIPIGKIAGFELQTPGVGSNWSTNWATTIAHVTEWFKPTIISSTTNLSRYYIKGDPYLSGSVCRPGFESQPHHLRLAFLNLDLNYNAKRTKIKQKEAVIGPYFKKLYLFLRCRPAIQDGLSRAARLVEHPMGWRLLQTMFKWVESSWPEKIAKCL